MSSAVMVAIGINALGYSHVHSIALDNVKAEVL